MKRLDLNIDDLVREYRAGKSTKELATHFGASSNVIQRRLAAAGVTLRGPNGAREVDVSEALRLFNAGTGLSTIATSVGCTPLRLSTILRTHGVEPRNRSEQQAVRMSRTTFEQRQTLVSAANAAVRGKPASEERMLAMSATYEANGTRRQSRYETELAAMLRERGIETIPQKAIGIYNCDLAADPVAVEVMGGKWHWHGEHLARTEKRFRDLMNRGWHVLGVAVTDTSPLTPAVADYVAAYVKQARSDPTARREYRVIWRAGEFAAAGGPDDDNFSIKPPFTNTRDVASGRYKTVRR